MQQRAEQFRTIKYPRKIFRCSRQIRKDIHTLLLNLRKHSQKGLHVGSGNVMISGLINCDLYNPKADIIADATDLSIFDNGSIDLIESHHMIEHLSFNDTERALNEWHRVLRPGGLVVLTFPDISGIFFKWAKYSLLYHLFPQPNKLEYVVKMLVGSQENEGMYHKNAFDINLMSLVLTKHRFCIDFSYYRYPMRTTPSRIVIARKID